MLLVVSPIADPGVTSLIPARPHTLIETHTYVEIDHEIFSTVILLPLIQKELMSV